MYKHAEIHTSNVSTCTTVSLIKEEEKKTLSCYRIKILFSRLHVNTQTEFLNIFTFEFSQKISETIFVNFSVD